MCSQPEKNVVVHKWTDAGLGSAPLRVVGMIHHPSPESYGQNVAGYNNAVKAAHEQAKAYGVTLCTCDYCGTGIMNNYVVKNAEGKAFVVGCDCVAKTDDTRVISQAKNLKRIHDRKLRDERRKREQAERVAKYEAEMETQRERNGGKTDREIEIEKQEAEDAKKRESFRQENKWMRDVLYGVSGNFAESMLRELERCRVRDLSDRCVLILQDIYAKSHGRRNSKKYDAAFDEFYELAEIEG